MHPHTLCRFLALRSVYNRYVLKNHGYCTIEEEGGSLTQSDAAYQYKQRLDQGAAFISSLIAHFYVAPRSSIQRLGPDINDIPRFKERECQTTRLVEGPNFPAAMLAVAHVLPVTPQNLAINQGKSHGLARVRDVLSGDGRVHLR